MANAKISVVSGGTTKTFVIEGFARETMRKSQQTPPLPIPLQSDEFAVLASVMGQVREFTLDFGIFQRTDDYTGGTGSPGSAPYSIADQKKYLMDTIFTQTGNNIYIDELGETFEGRIQDMEFAKAGDDPNSDGCIIRFTRGLAIA